MQILTDGWRHMQEQQPQADPLLPLYARIDFGRAVVAGSYALHQYTGDSHWSPNDVDIVTTADSLEHFSQTVAAFCASVPGSKIIKFNDFAQGHPNNRTPEEDRREHSASVCLDPRTVQRNACRTSAGTSDRHSKLRVLQVCARAQVFHCTRKGTRSAHDSACSAQRHLPRAQGQVRGERIRILLKTKSVKDGFPFSSPSVCQHDVFWLSHGTGWCWVLRYGGQV